MGPPTATSCFSQPEIFVALVAPFTLVIASFGPFVVLHCFCGPFAAFVARFTPFVAPFAAASRFIRAFAPSVPRSSRLQQQSPSLRNRAIRLCCFRYLPLLQLPKSQSLLSPNIQLLIYTNVAHYIYAAMHHFSHIVLLCSLLASSGLAQPAGDFQDRGRATTSLSTSNSSIKSSSSTKSSSTTSLSTKLSSTTSSSTKSSSTTSSYKTSVSTTRALTSTSSISISSTKTSVSLGSTPTAPRKRGVAYNDATLADEFLPYPKISWGYNWANHSAGLSSSLNYVPMLWGNYTDLTDGWNTAVDLAVASGSTHLLAFNEPDETHQSNLTVPQAVSLYKTYMQPYASKAKLGSPAVTNGGGTMGLSWLSDFMSECSACTIDFVAIHWYVNFYDFAHLVDMVNYIKNQTTTAYIKTGKPVWITEFGFLDSPTNDQVNSFLTEVMPWFDNQTYVERYSYFMVDPTKLLSAGSPSTVGSQANTYAT